MHLRDADSRVAHIDAQPVVEPYPASMQSDTPAPLTREQAEFQNSAQAAEMREIYRGGS